MTGVSVPLANVAICALIVFGVITMYPMAGGWSWLFLLMLAGLMSVKGRDPS